MIASVEVNSRDKLEKILRQLRRQGRGGSYDEFWGYNQHGGLRQTYLLYYCTETFKGEAFTRRLV